MIKTQIPYLIAQLDNYKAKLELARARGYDFEYQNRELSKTRLANLGKEIRITIAELNNYLTK